MRLLARIFRIFLLLLAVLTGVFFLGPEVSKPKMDISLPKVIPDLVELEQQIALRENGNGLVKPGNTARIIWYDSVPARTAYSIVYLHGWSASPMEGDPLHREIAGRYGCNLYLPRLAGHGLVEEEPMLNLTADALIDSAKEAIAVAKMLGNKVIIMATSTGGTLALHLAGSDEDIAGLLLYSPNIEIYDKSAKLLSGPWGLQLAKFVKDSDYHEYEADSLKSRYWTTKYRVEALTHLQALVDHTMTKETFERMTRPAFVGYFYKNETVQDRVVSVPAILNMYEKLGTPASKKRKVAFTEVNDHVMTSSITSEDLKSVRKETIGFLEEVLGLQAVSMP